MPYPSNANTSEFYRLMNGAVLAARGYKNLGEFWREEFINSFQSAQWRELFTMDTEENRTGKFTQYVGNRYIPVMAAYTTREGKAPLISNQGFELQTKDMPLMKLAYNFDEKSIEDGAYLEANGGTARSGSIFDGFRLDAAQLIAGIHVQRSYTSFQIESTGGYLSTARNNSGGLVGLQIDFNVPSGNKRKCGGYGIKGKKKAWTDPTSSPIGDLQDMNRYANDNGIMVGVYRMNQATHDTLVDHPDTRSRIAIWKTGGMVSDGNLTKVPVSDGDVETYITTVLHLPKIEVVKWKAASQYLDPDSQELKRLPMTAFADNTVLLRPSGLLGSIQWKKQTGMFATNDNPIFYTDNDSIAVQQNIYSDANAIQFTAKSTNIPVPGDTSQWLYLKTDEAAA
ncbi:MAG: major capsid protein [Bacteroides sp.]